MRDDPIDCKEIEGCNSLGIASLPILARLAGIEEINVTQCGVPTLEWRLASYSLLLRGVGKGGRLIVYTTPRPPTSRCRFELKRPSHQGFAVLAADLGLIRRREPGILNPNPYLNVFQLAVSNTSFPGCIRGNDVKYGIPSMPPLALRGAAGVECSSEKQGVYPENLLELALPKHPRCSGARGVARCYAGDTMFYAADKGYLFPVPVDVEVGVGVYRPPARILHPYMFIDTVMEDGVEYLSPVISIRTARGWVSAASPKPVRAYLERGVLHLSTSGEALIVRGNGVYALRSLLASQSSPVEVEGAPARGMVEVARIDWGSLVLEELSRVGERTYEALVYAPVDGAWRLVFRVPGRIEDVSIGEAEMVDRGVDRFRSVLAGPGVWRIGFRVGRKLSLIVG